MCCCRILLGGGCCHGCRRSGYTWRRRWSCYGGCRRTRMYRARNRRLTRWTGCYTGSWRWTSSGYRATGAYGSRNAAGRWHWRRAHCGQVRIVGQVGEGLRENRILDWLLCCCLSDIRLGTRLRYDGVCWVCGGTGVQRLRVLPVGYHIHVLIKILHIGLLHPVLHGQMLSHDVVSRSRWDWVCGQWWRQCRVNLLATGHISLPQTVCPEGTVGGRFRRSRRFHSGTSSRRSVSCGTS